jgi:CBS domain-containing protein
VRAGAAFGPLRATATAGTASPHRPEQRHPPAKKVLHLPTVIHFPPALPGDATTADALAAPELQIGDDSIVDSALDVLNRAHVDYLLVRGVDGRCVGLVTRAQLAPYRAQSWYTERIRLRDIVHDRGPYPGTAASLAAAISAMHARSLPALPVLDEDGSAVGVLTLSALRSRPADPDEPHATGLGAARGAHPAAAHRGR